MYCKQLREFSLQQRNNKTSPEVSRERKRRTDYDATIVIEMRRSRVQEEYLTLGGLSLLKGD